MEGGNKVPRRRFTVRGSRNGSRVHVTWTDGKLTGDPPTIDLILVEAELALFHPEDRQSWAGLVYAGAGLSNQPLSDAPSAYRLINSVLDTITTVEGDAPAESIDAQPQLQR
ncbi:hypothetical protein MSM1_09690 [Mycobacterium sp. SM1]|nr:hypothetical protein [Mycobacterium sp. SM1]